MLQRSKSPPIPLPRFGSAEDRREERRRVLLQGKILIGRETVWCAVRDLSNGGARLEIGEDVALPAEFDLVIGRREEIVRAGCAGARGPSRACRSRPCDRRPAVVLKIISS